MKLKYLWAACTVFFLVFCSNDDDHPNHPNAVIYPFFFYPISAD